MAAARARESERADRLFSDPLAAALAGPEGFTWLAHLEAAAWSTVPGLYPVIRTRFFDDFVLDSCRRLGVRQVVLAAAGLDTRAFRLDWPSRTRLYEMDLPEVLTSKEDVIGKAGAIPNCERLTVGVDLQEATWPEALVARGYRPERQSIWLIEGLLSKLSAKGEQSGAALPPWRAACPARTVKDTRVFSGPAGLAEGRVKAAGARAGPRTG
jgi:methyltransferase (TIGR00027 family)